jgi:hypothetical protein
VGALVELAEGSKHETIHPSDDFTSIIDALLKLRLSIDFHGLAFLRKILKMHIIHQNG